MASKTFRLSKRFNHIATAAIVFGLLMVAIALAATQIDDGADADGDQVRWWCSAIFLAFALMGLYLLAAYRRKSVTVQDRNLHAQLVFGTKEMDLSQVNSVLWRWRPVGGSVRLATGDKSMKIEFGEFDESERLELIRFIREQVPESRQQDWPAFCHRVAWPLRQGFPSSFIRDLPESARALTTRWRWDRMSMILLLVTFVVATVFWALFDIANAFSLPLVVILFWLLIRFSIPKEGRWDLRLTKQSIEFVFWPVLLSPAILLFDRFGTSLGLSNASITAAIILAACVFFARMLWIASRIDKERYRKVAENAPASVMRWNELESTGLRH